MDNLSYLEELLAKKRVKTRRPEFRYTRPLIQGRITPKMLTEKIPSFGVRRFKMSPNIQERDEDTY